MKKKDTMTELESASRRNFLKLRISPRLWLPVRPGRCGRRRPLRRPRLKSASAAADHTATATAYALGASRSYRSCS